MKSLIFVLTAQTVFGTNIATSPEKLLLAKSVRWYIVLLDLQDTDRCIIDVKLAMEARVLQELHLLRLLHLLEVRHPLHLHKDRMEEAMVDLLKELLVEDLLKEAIAHARLGLKVLP
jgi:hypothetical protein